MKIKKTYHVPFAADRVFDAWVSSRTVIPPATGMDIDPVVGGHYRLIMDTPDFAARNDGVFLAITPGSRLRYTWEWNADGNVTEITVDLRDDDDGCAIAITHAGFRDRTSMEQHADGWDSYVEGFTAFLAKNQPDG